MGLTPCLVDCVKIGLFRQPKVEDRFAARHVHEDIVTNNVIVAERIRGTVRRQGLCAEVGQTQVATSLYVRIHRNGWPPVTRAWGGGGLPRDPNGTLSHDEPQDYPIRECRAHTLSPTRPMLKELDHPELSINGAFELAPA